MGDLWDRGNILPFDQLRQQYELGLTEAFRYTQICHALLVVLPQDTKVPKASPLEDLLLTDYISKRATSFTYRKLLNNLPDPTVSLRNRWGADVGDVDDTEWQEALASPKEVGIPARLRLVQLKILQQIKKKKFTS